MDPTCDFYSMATLQFKIIDTTIQLNQFSTTYIDVAINTKKMIKASSQEERLSIAGNHIDLTYDKGHAITSLVCGAIFMLIGALFAATAPACPIFIIPALIATSAGVYCIKEGIDTITNLSKSPSVVVCSLFSVQRTADTIKMKNARGEGYHHVKKHSL